MLAFTLEGHLLSNEQEQPEMAQTFSDQLLAFTLEGQLLSNEQFTAAEEPDMAQMISDMMSEADTNKDGALQLSEIFVGMDVADDDDEDKQDLVALLQELDTDSNGQLDASELLAFGRRMEETSTGEQEDDYMADEPDKTWSMT